MDANDDAYAKKSVNGNRVWWRDRENKLHRADGPAVERGSGRKEWWWHGLLHREDGPALITRTFKRWYKNGNLHRDDGPAVEGPGKQEWYQDGHKMKPEQIAAVQAKIAQVRAGEELAQAFTTGLDHPTKAPAIKRLVKADGKEKKRR